MPRKIIGYWIVEAANLSKLATKVNEHIKQHLEPFGPIGSDPKQNLCWQAMVLWGES